MNDIAKKDIMGVGVTDASIEEVLEYIYALLTKKASKCMLVTPNPEMVMYARKHPEFAAILNHAQIAICDGIGLLWASRVLGKPLKGRISGVDLMESLCKESVRKGVSVGFLGGRGGVAEKTAICLKKRYPGLKVSFVLEEWPESVSSISYMVSSESKLPNTKYQIPNTDILFVAYGHPKQEEWIAANLPHIPVRVAMGVGGAFDYFGGRVVRAPGFIRNIGLEWLFRLIRQPWRIKRQLALISFILLVFRKKFASI